MAAEAAQRGDWDARGDSTVIDCDRCTMRGIGCGDCVVTVLLGGPPFGVELDEVEERAIEVLADAGLVPPLRMVEARGAPRGLSRSGQTASDRGVRGAHGADVTHVARLTDVHPEKHRTRVGGLPTASVRCRPFAEPYGISHRPAREAAWFGERTSRSGGDCYMLATERETVDPCRTAKETACPCPPSALHC